MLKSKIKFAREVRKKVSAFSLQPSAFACSAFTLVELLVVISILGILAALAVPALKNVSHADATVSASRQLLDDVARARQLAISRHTMVYMVFVPTNFWGALPNSWWTGLTPDQRTAATNLCDKQLTGYTFVACGAMGDQPGQHQWHYLAPWQTLPDGTFIAQGKFSPPPNYQIANFMICGFSLTNNIPFPTEDSPPYINGLPYIAFNYLGQLTTNGDVFIPLARGSMLPAINPATKAPVFGDPDVSEMPPGNSVSAYNIIDIEPLTGRATLQQPKMQ